MHCSTELCGDLLLICMSAHIQDMLVDETAKDEVCHIIRPYTRLTPR